MLTFVLSHGLTVGVDSFFYFLFFMPVCLDRTGSEVVEREGNGIGGSPQAWTRTRDSRSATVLQALTDTVFNK